MLRWLTWACGICVLGLIAFSLIKLSRARARGSELWSQITGSLVSSIVVGIFVLVAGVQFDRVEEQRNRDADERRFFEQSLDQESLRSRRLDAKDFSGLDLRDRELVGVSARHSRLRHVNLIRSRVDYAQFEGADLASGDLSESRLSFANFEGAVLTSASFRQSVATFAYFGRAGIDRSIGVDACFRGANFDRASLRSADLSGASLKNTSLVGADMRDALFTGADLSGANLTGARLSGAAFEGATYSASTLWPSDPPRGAVFSTADVACG